MRRRSLALLVVLLATSGPGTPPARACCNAIPVLSQPYLSTVGSVQQRLAAPGNEVTVFHTGCDPGPFFSSTPADNIVTVTFRPDLGNPGANTTTVTIPSSVPGDCVTLASTVACSSLKFTMPLADDQVGAVDDRIGPVGPAEILVTVGGQTAADIGPLFEPTTGCDKVPEQVFRHFTVLPIPNDVAAVAQGASVRMALDGCDDVLIPLDHRNVRSSFGSPLPVFETGLGTFCSQKPAPVIGCLLLRKIDRAIADAPRGPDLIQAFTISGQHVVPLIERDDRGGLFGISDTDFSVIRIDRSPGCDPTKARYNLRHRLIDGKGPIVFAQKDGVAAGGCQQARLQGTTATPELVAHADGANRVVIHSIATAGHDCGKNTKIVAAGGSDPAIAADGGVAAFIRDSDTTIRAFDADANEYTSDPGRIATVDAAVNRWPLAVADEHVYFRTATGPSSGPVLSVYDPAADAFTDIGAARVAEVNGAHTLALGSTNLAWAQAFGVAGTTSLGVYADHIANGGDVLAATDASTHALTAWLWPPTAPIPTSAFADDIGTTAGCTRTGTCKTRVVLATPEGLQGTDLNGDGDQTDRVLRLYDAFAQHMDTTHRAVQDFVPGARVVAFRVPEGAQGPGGGTDLNNDGDKSDFVMHALVFDDTQAGFHVQNSGYSALGREGPWHDLGWRTPYIVIRDEILFLTRQGGADSDPAAPIWLVVYHPPSDTVGVIAPISVATPGTVLVLNTPAQGPTIQGLGLALGDADGDGVLDPFDDCQTARNVRQHDDDYDGLGDGACDRTRCSDFTPPRDFGRRGSPPGAADAAERYLVARAKASRACLDQPAPGPGGRDLDLRCRGSFVASVENPPLEARTVSVERAEQDLLQVLGVDARLHGSLAAERLAFARQVVRAYGEAVNAATRAAYGATRRPPGAAVIDLQQNLGAEVTRHLDTLVHAMQQCAFGARHAAHGVGPACLGRLEGGTLVPPTDSAVQRAIEDADVRLRAAVAGLTGRQLDEFGTCASRTGERDCFACTNWRNAVRAVLTLGGAGASGS